MCFSPSSFTSITFFSINYSLNCFGDISADNANEMMGIIWNLSGRRYVCVYESLDSWWNSWLFNSSVFVNRHSNETYKIVNSIFSSNFIFLHPFRLIMIYPLIMHEEWRQRGRSHFKALRSTGFCFEPFRLFLLSRWFLSALIIHDLTICISI